MPFKRASRLGGLYLTPPSLLTFVISLVLAILAIGSLYTRIPGIGTFVSAHRFWMMVAAYVVLALGALLRGI